MKNKVLLILIIVLAIFLRFYKLDKFPVSLYWDEAANGYNAYSIVKTKSDEYGTKLPLLFRSFNDYKLPGYIYLDTFFIKFLGLSEFSVRAPSAFFGVLAVPLMYLLTKELLKTFDSKLEIRNWKLEIPIIAAAMMAISPWHLQFSRAAFEANISLTFVLFGVVLLFYGLRNRFFALLSIPILATSIFFYHSPKIFVPLILITFFAFFKKLVSKNLRYYLLGFVISLIFITPLIVQTTRPQGIKHISEISIFADKSKIASYVEAKAQNPGILSSFLLNRRIPYVFEAMHNYLSHFSFGFLFFGDDPNPRHHLPYHGNMYLFEIPLIFLGAWILIKKVELKSRWFLIIWLLIAPLSAAFAQQSPHSLRSVLMLPPLVILSSLGLGVLILRRKIFRLFLVTTMAVFFLNYIYSYYFVYPIKNSSSWAYGYKQMFSQVAEIENNYDTIIITGHYWKPYIYYLFYSQKSSALGPQSARTRTASSAYSRESSAYNKVDPQSYLANWNQELIGKYKFGTTYWDSGGKDLTDAAIDSAKNAKTLVAISPEEFHAIEKKERFIRLFTISDYSKKQEVFLIGEWR